MAHDTTCGNMNGEAPASATVTVWDRGVRGFHWLTVILVSLTATTGFLGGKQTIDVHVWAGTAITALVVLRIVWGVLGTAYARFESFIRAPSVVVTYAYAQLAGRAPHYVGHNPLGALMIVALIGALAALAATGTIVLGGVVKEGPLASFTPYAIGQSAKWVHEALAVLLLGMVAVHVAAVIAESIRTGDDLVRAMLTGRKRVRPGMLDTAPRHARPCLALAIGASVIACSTTAIVWLSRHPALGVPTTPLDTAYRKECGACHTAHHPSLAPASTWSAVFAGLGNHFGEDASLDDRTAAALVSYATANSAQHWDTLAANDLRESSSTAQPRITATVGWQRLHRHVPEEAFERKSVGGRANCASCHADAERGRFAPRAITIPDERRMP